MEIKKIKTLEEVTSEILVCQIPENYKQICEIPRTLKDKIITGITISIGSLICPSGIIVVGALIDKKYDVAIASSLMTVMEGVLYAQLITLGRDEMDKEIKIKKEYKDIMSKVITYSPQIIENTLNNKLFETQDTNKVYQDLEKIVFNTFPKIKNWNPLVTFEDKISNHNKREEFLDKTIEYRK